MNTIITSACENYVCSNFVRLRNTNLYRFNTQRRTHQPMRWSVCCLFNRISKKINSQKQMGWGCVTLPLQQWRHTGILVAAFSNFPPRCDTDKTQFNSLTIPFRLRTYLELYTSCRLLVRYISIWYFTHDKMIFCDLKENMAFMKFYGLYYNHASNPFKPHIERI